MVYKKQYILRTINTTRFAITSSAVWNYSISVHSLFIVPIHHVTLLALRSFVISCSYMTNRWVLLLSLLAADALPYSTSLLFPLAPSHNRDSIAMEVGEEWFIMDYRSRLSAMVTSFRSSSMMLLKGFHTLWSLFTFLLADLVALARSSGVA